MKIAAIGLACFAQLALADTTISTPTPSFGNWILKRGSATIATGSGVLGGCRVRAAADAEATKATASYSCAQTETDSFTVTYRAATGQCASTKPADDTQTQTASCPTGTFGTYQWTQTRSYALFATPICWQAGAWLPASTPPPPAGACPTTAATGTYSTSFAQIENPLSEGGKWRNGHQTGIDWTDPRSIGGGTVASSAPTPTRYSDDIGHIDPGFLPFSPNQYAEGVVYRAPGYPTNLNHEVELLLRFDISPHQARGYEVGFGNLGYWFVVRWNGPVASYTAIHDAGLGSLASPQDGDVMRAEIVGNIITVKKNGAVIGTVNVTSQGGTVWQSGQPGIGFWPVDGADPSKLGWKSFTAGPLP